MIKIQSTRNQGRCLGWGGGGGGGAHPPTARAQYDRHILQCFCRNYYYYRNNY